MKKFLPILFTTIIALTPSATFAISDNTSDANFVETLNNTKEVEEGSQKYGHDGKEAQDCAQAMLEYPKFKYLITDYDLAINVAEDNKYKITEEYDVCFAKAGSHGIYRDIPTLKDFWRENGDVTKNVKMQVTNVNVIGDVFDKSREDDNIHLKIGNVNRTLNHGDSKHYTITYDYNFGPDNLNGVDEFYFNIIGSEWASDVIFLNTDFEINFPKDIEENKIGFTHGYKKDSLSGGTPFELKNNKSIQGHYYDSLKGGEALTIRVTLPEGYIQNAAYETNEKAFKIFAIISTIIDAIAILTFFKYGRDEKLDLHTRNNPPEGMNPVQFGALVNSSSSDDVTSLFYYLAEQGYLRIEETRKRKYDIIILKDYGGKDQASRVFMDSLKLYDSDKDGRISVSSLRNSFYTKIRKINEAAGIKELRKKIYTKSGNTYQVLTYLALAIYIIAGVIFLIFDPYADENASIALLIISFAVIPGSANVISGLRSILKDHDTFSGIVQIVFGSLFAYMPLRLVLSLGIQMDRTQIASVFVIIATGIIITLCASKGKKYTEEGKRIMTEVLSYYESIKSCCPDAEHGFSYYYYTFAFAFAAGLSTAFSKKFKNAISQPPTWYSSRHSFNHFDANSFARSMKSISSNSSSSPGSSGSSSSGSSGGSSGGGSSGGGGGGGGGGGW